MKKKFITLTSLILMLFSLTGCSTKDEKLTSISDTEFKFNTIMTITLYGYNDQAVFDEIWTYVDQMEQSFSSNIETSDVSKFNASNSTQPIKVPQDLVYMYDRALPFNEATGGKFDLTIEPVVKLWGISTDNPKVPDQASLDEALKHVNYKNILVDVQNNTMTKLDPQTHIDLGGIAKGYAADQLASFIQSKGIEKAILNLGGNIFALGSKGNGEPWNVGIQNPYEPNGDVLGTIKAINKSIVTSGSYERFFEQDGKKYHHILDPDNGYPIENELVSVSIISDYSIDGDILSTSTFSLGLENGMNLIDSLEKVAAIFVTKDKEIYFAGDKELLSSFVLKNSAFTIKE